MTYVSPNQVKLQVPWELQGQSSTQDKVTIDYSNGNVVTLPLADYAPALFQGADGLAGALDQNSALPTSSNAAQRGQVVQLLANGLGPVSKQPASGDLAPSLPLAETKTAPVVTIGGQAATLTFSGLAPGFASLYRIDGMVPTTIDAGTQPTVVAIGSFVQRGRTFPYSSGGDGTKRRSPGAHGLLSGGLPGNPTLVRRGQDRADMADELQGRTQSSGALNAGHEEAVAKILVGAAEPVQVRHQIDRHRRDRGGEDAPDPGVAQAHHFQLPAHLPLQIRGRREDILHAFGVDRAVIGEKVVVGLAASARAADSPQIASRIRTGLPERTTRATEAMRSAAPEPAGCTIRMGAPLPGHPVAGYTIALAGAAQDDAVALDRALHLARATSRRTA